MSFGYRCSLCGQFGTKDNPTEQVKGDTKDTFDVLHKHGCATPMQYEQERRNIERILGSWEEIGVDILDITAEIYWQAHAEVIGKAKILIEHNKDETLVAATKRQLKKSKKEIWWLKKEIRKNRTRTLPVVAFDFRNNHIADGCHRIIAYYECDVFSIPALSVKRREG